MAIGHYLFRGDKTVCGGRIIEGCTDHQFFDKDMACEGHKVTCGKHAGRFCIAVALAPANHVLFRPSSTLTNFLKNQQKPKPPNLTSLNFPFSLARLPLLKLIASLTPVNQQITGY